jgi:hypothetical protein
MAVSMFRMAHVFLSLGQLAQAQQVAAAAATASALHPAASSKSAQPEELSLYGACQLVLAIASAWDNDRGQAHEHLDEARKIADRCILAGLKRSRPQPAPWRSAAR